ncbi:MAG: hypothetical protein JST00_37865 [Deltaproteobacteria bacterium]|nr:hypothetical protein [Deltaproteobacteria bacterium]
MLQFSVARYERGVRPEVGVAALQQLLEEFASQQGRRLFGVTASEGRVRIARGDLPSAAETLRVWYISNGDDVALLTYVAEYGADERVLAELSELDELVASVSFD